MNSILLRRTHLTSATPAVFHDARVAGRCGNPLVGVPLPGRGTFVLANVLVLDRRVGREIDGD